MPPKKTAKKAAATKGKSLNLSNLNPFSMTIEKAAPKAKAPAKGAAAKKAAAAAEAPADPAPKTTAPAKVEDKTPPPAKEAPKAPEAAPAAPKKTETVAKPAAVAPQKPTEESNGAKVNANGGDKPDGQLIYLGSGQTAGQAGGSDA